MLREQHRRLSLQRTEPGNRRVGCCFFHYHLGEVRATGPLPFWVSPPSSPAPLPVEMGPSPAGGKQSLPQLRGRAASISFPSLPELLLSHLRLYHFINHPGLLSKSGLSFRVLVSK